MTFYAFFKLARLPTEYKCCFLGLSLSGNIDSASLHKGKCSVVVSNWHIVSVLWSGHTALVVVCLFAYFVLNVR